MISSRVRCQRRKRSRESHQGTVWPNSYSGTGAGEELTSNARTLLGSERPLVAPDLIFAEVGNVAWKRARKGEISAEHARAAAQALPQLLSLTVPTVGLLSPALRIALTFEHPIYDCMYLALAEQREAQFVTANTRLLERLAGSGWAGPTVSLAEITP